MNNMVEGWFGRGVQHIYHYTKELILSLFRNIMSNYDYFADVSLSTDGDGENESIFLNVDFGDGKTAEISWNPINKTIIHLHVDGVKIIDQDLKLTGSIKGLIKNIDQLIESDVIKEGLVNVKKKNVKYFGDYPNGSWYKIERDENGKDIYYENSAGDWSKKEYDENGDRIYYEDSWGVIVDKRNQVNEGLVNVVKKIKDIGNHPTKEQIVTLFEKLQKQYGENSDIFFDDGQDMDGNSFDMVFLELDVSQLTTLETIDVGLSWENNEDRDMIFLRIVANPMENDGDDFEESFDVSMKTFGWVINEVNQAILENVTP